METAPLQGPAASWAESASAWLLSSGISIAAVLLLALFAARLLRSSIRRLSLRLEDAAAGQRDDASPEAAKRISTLTGIFSSGLTMVIWTVAILTALDEAGVDVGPVLAGAGIVGLAVGFGAQNLVRDVISGFFMLLENQVRVGDVAVINGTGGVVEAVRLRTIVLRDQAGAVHVFPNGTVDTLANLTKGWSAAVYEIGVAYREDTDRVAGIMKRTAQELQSDPDFADKIIEPIEMLGVEAFAESAVIIKARQKTKPMEQWSVGREYRRRLKKDFEREGVEIPFPHLIVLRGEGDGPDP